MHYVRHVIASHLPGSHIRLGQLQVIAITRSAERRAMAVKLGADLAIDATDASGILPHRVTVLSMYHKPYPSDPLCYVT